MIFDDTTIEIVRSALERLMCETKPVVTHSRLTSAGELSGLALEQIYWACCKLHETHWLRDRPLFEGDHVYVSWSPSRHQAYD